MKNKRTLVKGFILLLLVAVLISLLFQLGQTKTVSEPVVKPDSFVEIAFEGMEIDKESIKEEKIEDEPD